MTAIEKLLEHLQTSYPNVESPTGETDIQNALTEYEALKLLVKYSAEGDNAGLFDLNTSLKSKIPHSYRQNIRVALMTLSSIQNSLE